MRFRFEGMHRGDCAHTLSLALGRLDGVRDAKADFESKLVNVSLDESRLRETIEACGFTPLALAG